MEAGENARRIDRFLDTTESVIITAPESLLPIRFIL
jgi:hypothetical protein